MKLLFLTLLISTQTYAKTTTEYTCSGSNDLKLELSLLDSKNPSLSIQSKNIKAALCMYETLPQSRLADKNAASTEAQWYLKLKKCDYYSSKIKDQIHINETASFKQASSQGGSYLQVFKDQQPLFCTPKK